MHAICGKWPIFNVSAVYMNPRDCSDPCGHRVAAVLVLVELSVARLQDVTSIQTHIRESTVG